MSALATFRNGLTYDGNAVGDGLKIIGVSDFGRLFRIDYDHLQRVRGFDDLDEASLLRNGDLLFVRSNGNRRLIGRVLYIERVNERIGHSGFTIKARISDERLSPLFAALYFASPVAKRHIHRLGGGTNISNLNQDILGVLPIPLPPLQEQKRIEKVLMTWEIGVERLTELIIRKISIKQGLVKQILTGKRRFREFETCAIIPTRLYEVFDKVADAVDVEPTRMYQEIGIRSHGRGLFHKQPVLGHILAEKRVYRVVPDCLTLNIVFAWERALAVTTSQEEGMVVSHRFPMFRPNRDRILPEYALMYMLSQPGEEALQLASPGGAGRNRTLSQTAFLKTPIPLPSVDEQRRIVDFIIVIDLEIETLQKHLAALKDQKKGLMQKLLTGEVRVKGEP